MGCAAVQNLIRSVVVALRLPVKLFRIVNMWGHSIRCFDQICRIGSLPAPPPFAVLIRAIRTGHRPIAKRIVAFETYLIFYV